MSTNSESFTCPFSKMTFEYPSVPKINGQTVSTDPRPSEYWDVHVSVSSDGKQILYAFFACERPVKEINPLIPFAV